MNASLIRSACGGFVKLTDPVILVQAGLIYMLSVYHEGSVACHLRASPAWIHHLLYIKISRVKISLSHGGHTHSHTVPHKAYGTGGGITAEEVEWQLSWRNDGERKVGDHWETAEEWWPRSGGNLCEKWDKWLKNAASKQIHGARLQQRRVAVKRCYRARIPRKKAWYSRWCWEMQPGKVSVAGRFKEQATKRSARDTEKLSGWFTEFSQSNLCLRVWWGPANSSPPLLLHPILLSPTHPLLSKTVKYKPRFDRSTCWFFLKGGILMFILYAINVVWMGQPASLEVSSAETSFFCSYQKCSGKMGAKRENFSEEMQANGLSPHSPLIKLFKAQENFEDYKTAFIVP